MSEMICNVKFHFDNLDKYYLMNNDTFKEAVKNLFIHYRHEFCEVFNAKIDEINKAWDETGKPCSFGDYVEDMNPEYSKFIKDRLDNDFDKLNKDLNKNHCLIEFYLDEYCDICAKLRRFPDVKIWITLENIREA